VSKLRTPGRVDEVDVVIVGGGVLGCAVAARLSQTTASVCLIEAAADVCEGASKGNAGNVISFYGEPGTEETALLNASNPRFDELCSRLGVPFRRIGAVMVATTEEEEERLAAILEQVHACGVQATALTAGQVRSAEPLVTEDCRAGLSLPDEAIIDPMRLTVAYASLAAQNGARIMLGEKVIGVQKQNVGFVVETTDRRINARFVVNAAGLGAARISELAGGETFTSWPRRGQYLVLDRAFGSQLSKIVFSTATAKTKGINVMPTTNGSALLGPTAQDAEDGDDSRATDRETLDHVRAQAAVLVPATVEAHAIKAFAANRPASDERHRVRFDVRVPGLLHLHSRSAGVSMSPAAADSAVTLLKDAGLDVTERRDATTVLPVVQRLRTAADPQALIARDPRYGQIVCACENVSAAEIDAALNCPVPATSVDGVRKRTGAAYGRCQGSLCMAGISFMTAMRHGQGPADVRQTSGGTVGASWT
jgi:glycerol-3-phosphate dehydrogenase